MPVPTDIDDLSTNPALNDQPGSDNVFPGLDDHLRFGYSCIAQLRDQSTAFTRTLLDDTTAGEALNTLGLLNVKGYGAVGDGATNDQTALAAAVAAAYAAGAPLYWPAGTYVSTASIPNFHDVKHTGPGVVKRGSSLFYVQPRGSQSNTLYCAPSTGLGASANDGLSSSEPTLPLTACNALVNYGPVLDGTWSILLADGTYNFDDSTSHLVALPANIRARNTITIRAATDAGGSRVAPAVTINRGAQTAFTSGVRGGGRLDVSIKDIKCVGFKGGASPNADAFSAGFRFGQGAAVAYTNCHAEDCDLAFYNFTYVRYTATGCVSTSCDAGFQDLFFVSRTITEDADYTQVTGGTYGLRAKEFCTGHANGLRVDGATYGVHLNRNCTTNMSGAVVYNASVGVLLRSSSWAWINNVDFGFGTANDCDVMELHDAASGLVVEEEQLHSNRFTGRGERLVASYTPSTPFAHSGNTSETSVTDLSKLRRGAMAQPGAYVRCVVLGRKSGSAGAVTVLFRYGASNTCSIAVPAADTQFKLEFNLFTKTKGTQQAWSFGSGTTGNFVARGDRTFNFDSGDGNLSLRVQLANAADSVTIDGAWVYTTEGLIEEALI